MRGAHQGLIRAALMMACSAALAAPLSPYALTPEQQFQQDMQACDALSPLFDQDACRTEARHALAEARKGQLRDPGQTPYKQNATERCDVFTGSDRQDCLDRICMPSKEEGSVEDGGVLRERITILPGQ